MDTVDHMGSFDIGPATCGAFNYSLLLIILHTVKLVSVMLDGLLWRIYILESYFYEEPEIIPIPKNYLNHWNKDTLLGVFPYFK